MRTYFRSLSDVLGSPLAQTAQTFSPRHAGGHRVLKSTKLEDAAYRDLRRGDNELDALEKACGEKLSTFPALSRDIYQSFYSLNVRRQPEDAISEQARRFNAPILNEVMDGEDYPAIKAACEGRQLPAYEAASEFISQVAGNLDELLEKASGKKGALNTLERLEQKRDRSMEELQKLMKQIAQAGPEQLPELEKQAVKAANQAQSQVNQTEAVGHMVRDQMLQNKEAVSGCFAQAVRAAAQKAESVSSALLAWGYGPDSNDPERRAADLELAARVGKSPTLMEVARYLGRLKELMDGKRKKRLCLWPRREVQPGAGRRHQQGHCLGVRHACRAGDAAAFPAQAPAKGTQAVPAPGAHLQGKRRHHLYAGRVQFCGEPSTLV